MGTAKNFHTFPPTTPKKPVQPDPERGFPWKFLVAGVIAVGLVFWIIAASTMTTDDDRVHRASSNVHTKAVMYNGAKISQGMSKSEVTRILGSPDSVNQRFSPGGTREEWIYSSKGANSHLLFEEGKLTDFTPQK